MKKMQKAIWILAVLLAAGCANSTGGGGGGGNDNNNNNNTGGVDYTNYNSGYVFRVRNSTSEKLVAFKGSLAAGNLIGGIPAQAQNHGLKRNPNLFTTTEDFPLVLITEEQYNTNKLNLQALEQTPFTRILAFYNSSGQNETVYEISGKLGGNKTILIQNGISMNVELRLNGTQGETLGYASANMYNTALKVAPDDYLVFPVFKKYNAVRNEIITVYPKYSGGGQAGQAKHHQFSLDDGNPEMSLSFPADYLNGTTFSSGAAWLVVNNQAHTGIQLQKGGAIQYTPGGIKTINNGFSRTFQIDMPSAGQNQYASEITISAYTVGPTTNQVTIGTHTLQADHIYVLTVTTQNETDLVLNMGAGTAISNFDNF